MYILIYKDLKRCWRCTRLRALVLALHQVACTGAVTAPGCLYWSWHCTRLRALHQVVRTGAGTAPGCVHWCRHCTRMTHTCNDGLLQMAVCDKLCDLMSTRLNVTCLKFIGCLLASTLHVWSLLDVYSPQRYMSEVYWMSTRLNVKCLKSIGCLLASTLHVWSLLDVYSPQRYMAEVCWMSARLNATCLKSIGCLLA